MIGKTTKRHGLFNGHKRLCADMEADDDQLLM